jgi:G3E family GTPase
MRVTLNVITGILGSGKTTALLHLLDAPALGKKPAVVVGEFAEEGLDGTTLGNAGATVRQITGTGTGDATRSYVEPVRELVEDQEHPRIYLETSGVTQIGRLARELSGADLGGEVVFGPTVAVLDAGAFDIHDRYFPAQLWAQVDVADVIIVNKTDRAHPDQLDAIRRRVLDRNPAARVLFAYMGQVRRAEVLGIPAEGFVPRLLARDWADEGTAEFESFVYRSKLVCFDRVMVGHKLLNLPGGHIARFKGVLKCWDRSHVVNGLPGQLDWDPTPAEGRTRLAFIGLHLEERKAAITALLDAELTAQQSDGR